ELGKLNASSPFPMIKENNNNQSFYASSFSRFLFLNKDTTTLRKSSKTKKPIGTCTAVVLNYCKKMQTKKSNNLKIK
ncbi:hypothetical protein DD876_13235, partial [Staphylococcus pseudintermedius]|uniref:hypothetical protein n=2 Tax=Staphylococcus pseudintermedius TaxID=283734 RepID=UPI000DA0B2A6